jgi:molybdate transport system regulatory protein
MRASDVITPLVRFRIDFGTRCCVGPGKIALLEAIHRTGSLSQAARDLGMSYRRAWQLASSLNASFHNTIVLLTRGGRGGGGAQLTDVGRELISQYRTFEGDIQARAERAFRALSGQARKRSRSAAAAPIIRLSNR